ncbi:hypothetical protein D030_1720B, partial [Vibrio parahaemolyticus AQ3810]
WVSQS